MTSVDFDPEFAGSVASQQAQAVILARLQEIAASPGMVSRGTRVAVFDAWRRTPEEMLGIASRFGSAIFFLHRGSAARCRQFLTEAGFSTSSFLVYASSGPAFAVCDAVLADDLPDRLALRPQRIDASSPGQLVAQAQHLLTACGLPALPGYFLRGRTQRNLTLALLDPAGTVVGMAIAMDEAGAGPAYAGWYFPASVAVADGWKGKGLGRWLNAAVIDLARREGGAVHVQEGVSPANMVSRRMIEGCGLALEEGITVILAAAEAPPAAWRD